MSRHQRPSLWLSVCVLVAIGVASASPVSAADEDNLSAQNRFEEIVPWVPSEFLPAGKVSAFEEHAHFAYLAATKAAKTQSSLENAHTRLIFLRPATLVVDVWPVEEQQREAGKPIATSHVEVPLATGGKAKRAILVYRAPDKPPQSESIRVENDGDSVVITESDRILHLALPLDLRKTGRIAIKSADGEAILSSRQLPAGVMPHGPEGMRMVEGWDSRYRGDSRPAWDKGFPSTHLKAAVDSGVIKPGRAVVLGCGTGTNAIYLATRGFDVTAIDIAPTALSLAEEKARKEGVQVRWLLADVLAPPTHLETFDFIFDRGCYHGVRRNDADGYVRTIQRLSRTGTHILILAGNANEERHYGPPRVEQKDLRTDFSSGFRLIALETVRFDSVDPKEQGALAWSILLRRMATEADADP